MKRIIENNPDNVLNPNLKVLLNERRELNQKRKSSKNFFERMKLSSQISALDKQISNYSFKIK